MAGRARGESPVQARVAEEAWAKRLQNPNRKHQRSLEPGIPTPKSQAPNNSQMLSSNERGIFRRVFGTWCLEFSWNLELGIWNFTGAWCLELGASCLVLIDLVGTLPAWWERSRRARAATQADRRAAAP